VGGSRLRQAKQRLVPLEAPGHVGYANDRPHAPHRFLRNLTIIGLIPEKMSSMRPPRRSTLRFYRMTRVLKSGVRLSAYFYGR
jgi:hypothetical protein